MSDDLIYFESELHPSLRPLEIRVQLTLRDIFSLLLSVRGLYQNLHLPTELFNEGATAEFSAEVLAGEYISNPIIPVSKGDGDNLRLAAHRDSRSGGLGSHGHLSPRGFFLPNITTECEQCGRYAPFLSQSNSFASYHGHFVPPRLKPEHPLRQLYNIFYRCSDCGEHAIGFLVLRDGFKFQLVGRSSPYRPALEPEWPKDIAPIAKDAGLAVSEGDIAAGYYHLRTALEHYLKGVVSIPLVEKIEGTALCDAYNATLDVRLKSGFASVAEIYSALSLGMHTRDVSPEAFYQIRKKLLDHFKAKALFAEYQT